MSEDNAYVYRKLLTNISLAKQKLGVWGGVIKTGR